MCVAKRKPKAMLSKCSPICKTLRCKRHLTSHITCERRPKNDAAILLPVLQRHTECGELRLRTPPESGYSPGETIWVEGNFATARQRVALNDAVQTAAPAQTISFAGEVLNATLCRIDRAQPNAPSGGVSIRYGFGDKPDSDPEGRYFVGENPVIDVILPASMTSGHLFVSALDVSGKVFHMLPNLLSPESDIAILRQGAARTFTLRVAHPLSDAQQGDKLAFVVDDTALGKSKIMAIHGREQVFNGLRPMTESAES